MMNLKFEDGRSEIAQDLFAVDDVAIVAGRKAIKSESEFDKAMENTY